MVFVHVHVEGQLVLPSFTDTCFCLYAPSIQSHWAKLFPYGRTDMELTVTVRSFCVKASETANGVSERKTEVDWLEDCADCWLTSECSDCGVSDAAVDRQWRVTSLWPLGGAGRLGTSDAWPSRNAHRMQYDPSEAYSFLASHWIAPSLTQPHYQVPFFNMNPEHPPVLSCSTLFL